MAQLNTAQEHSIVLHCVPLWLDKTPPHFLTRLRACSSSIIGGQVTLNVLSESFGIVLGVLCSSVSK